MQNISTSKTKQIIIIQKSSKHGILYKKQILSLFPYPLHTEDAVWLMLNATLGENSWLCSAVSASSLPVLPPVLSESIMNTASPVLPDTLVCEPSAFRHGERESEAERERNICVCVCVCVCAVSVSVRQGK